MLLYGILLAVLAGGFLVGAGLMCLQIRAMINLMQRIDWLDEGMTLLMENYKKILEHEMERRTLLEPDDDQPRQEWQH